MFSKTIEKLETELKELTYQLNVVIPKDLNAAAALGDLSENAEYDEARDRKRLTESRISHIHARLRTLKSIDLSKVPRKGAGLLSIVTLEDLDSGDEITYELVTADDVDVEAGKISIQAPIGRAIMGKEEGDEISVTMPAGKKEYLINKLITVHSRQD